MTDREAIAQAIYQAWADWESVTHGDGEVESWPDEAADAVLADLGDRLLPVLPDWAEIDSVDPIVLRDGSDGYVANVSGKLRAGQHMRDQLTGYGPTIAAAIRAALEQP